MRELTTLWQSRRSRVLGRQGPERCLLLGEGPGPPPRPPPHPPSLDDTPSLSPLLQRHSCSRLLFLGTQATSQSTLGHLMGSGPRDMTAGDVCYFQAWPRRACTSLRCPSPPPVATFLEAARFRCCHCEVESCPPRTRQSWCPRQERALQREAAGSPGLAGWRGSASAPLTNTPQTPTLHLPCWKVCLLLVPWNPSDSPRSHPQEEARLQRSSRRRLWHVALHRRAQHDSLRPGLTGATVQIRRTSDANERHGLGTEPWLADGTARFS